MEKNKNMLLALGIGLALIFIVGSITFLRPYLAKKKETTQLEELKKIDEGKINKITSQEIFQMMANQVKLNILDLRNPEEFASEHIIGSKNPTDEELADILAGTDKSLVSILVEKSGDRVGKIILKELNYPRHILYLEGGFDSWKSAGYPTISFGNIDSFSDRAKIKYLSIDEFKKMKESGEPFTLIDIRDKEAYEREKIDGSLNFPLAELETKRLEIPGGKALLILGGNALESFQGAVRLFDLGFYSARTFKEDFSALKSAGL